MEVRRVESATVQLFHPDVGIAGVHHRVREPFAIRREGRGLPGARRASGRWGRTARRYRPALASSADRFAGIPDWVKATLDEWTQAAAIRDGRLFRCVNRSGAIWGDGITEKVVWHIVKDSAKRAGLQNYKEAVVSNFRLASL